MFERPEGEEVTATNILEVPPAGAPPSLIPRQTIYIDSVGIRVTRQRVDVFVNEVDEDSHNLVEQVCLRLIKTLPHTPLGPVGINFAFVHSDPDTEPLDKLKIRDSIHQHYKIQGCSLTSTIEEENDVQLNLTILDYS